MRAVHRRSDALLGKFGRQDVHDHVPAQRLVACDKDTAHVTDAQLAGEGVPGPQRRLELVAQQVWHSVQCEGTGAAKRGSAPDVPWNIRHVAAVTSPVP